MNEGQGHIKTENGETGDVMEEQGANEEMKEGQDYVESEKGLFVR